MLKDVLKNKIIPNTPGVYLLKGAAGRIIYVGKARNLKKRLNSYVHQENALTPAKQNMVAETGDIEYIVVTNEAEALLLEANLIQKHQPKYNIVLKDDKSFVYLKIDYSLPWPELTITRRPGGFAGLKKKYLKNVRYFGPYTSGSSARELLKTVRKIFPVCLQPRQKETERPRPCFNYQIHRCLGACLDEADRGEYLEMYQNISHFLKGNVDQVIGDLKKRMNVLAEQKKYELAAKTRNELQALIKVQTRQKMVSVKNLHQDYASLALFDNLAIAHIFVVRAGKLVSSLNFRLAHVQGKTNSEIIGDFLEQYYNLATDQPKEVIVAEAINAQLKKIKIITAKIGLKKELLDLGLVNAREYYYNLQASWQKKDAPSSLALAELQAIINSTKKLERLECYDISNIQGRFAVGAMAVITHGQLDKKEYRKFKIKIEGSPNDVGMMREVLTRRFGLGERTHERELNWPRPDLIILDGGQPQLNAVLALFKKNNLDLPMLALAKRQEEIFLPRQREPLLLPKNSPVLHLIQRLRDEAHRFAISYFSLRQRRASLQSALDAVPGVGPVLKKKLIHAFGSTAAIKAAPPDAIEKIAGPKTAQAIKEYL